MDAVAANDAPEAEASARQTLALIVRQCAHTLTQRLAKRFSTKDQLKNLERRAAALLKAEDGPEFDRKFEQIVASADETFDAVIAETKVAGHA